MPIVNLIFRGPRDLSKPGGMMKDALLVSDIFRDRGGWTVNMYNTCDESREIIEADLNIFFEHVRPSLLPYAKQNVLIVNQEIPQLWYIYGKLDAILCKTRYAENLMRKLVERHQWPASVFFIGFATHGVTPAISRKDYRQVLNVSGKSLNKNTGCILKTWYRNPQFPDLHVVIARWMYLIFDPLGRYAACHNIRIHHDLPRDQLQRLQNQCGIHLCTSIAEGFGHYINEARAIGATIVATDGPPMNELIRHKQTGYLISPAAQLPISMFGPGVPGSRGFFIAPSSLEAGLNEILDTPFKELERWGIQAQQEFLNGRADFQKRMRQWVASIE